MTACLHALCNLKRDCHSERESTQFARKTRKTTSSNNPCATHTIKSGSGENTGGFYKTIFENSVSTVIFYVPSKNLYDIIFRFMVVITMGTLA